MAVRFGSPSERRLGVVPAPILALLVTALIAQVGWQAGKPRPVAHAADLVAPPPHGYLRVASLGEPIAFGQMLTLYLQAFDNQPGISIPFKDLDYSTVIAWLESILALDPETEYPLLMASQLYGQVPDEARQRMMFDFVHRKFLERPDRRWRWLAHCAILAKHRLNDTALALRFAEDIARYARSASNWARQMRIFILEDMGEKESAAILLGGLLVSGEISDPSEIRFLTERLETLKSAGKSSPLTKNRQ